MEVYKVILVDDHQIIIDGLRSLLEEEPNVSVVGEGSNGKEAIKLVELLEPHVVMMDIDMPILNGIEATRLIKKNNDQIKVIILSMHNERSLIKTLINSGADGYLLKNCDKQELVNAINTVGSGKSYFSSDVTLSLLDKNSNSQSGFTNQTNVADLTERETEILKLIAEGLSNKEIGDKLFISHRTVDTHRTNLMKKVKVNNIAGLIRFAINAGFVS